MPYPRVRSTTGKTGKNLDVKGEGSYRQYRSIEYSGDNFE